MAKGIGTELPDIRDEGSAGSYWDISTSAVTAPIKRLTQLSRSFETKADEYTNLINFIAHEVGRIAGGSIKPGKISTQVADIFFGPITAVKLANEIELIIEKLDRSLSAGEGKTAAEELALAEIESVSLGVLSNYNAPPALIHGVPVVEVTEASEIVMVKSIADAHSALGALTRPTSRPHSTEAIIEEYFSEELKSLAPEELRRAAEAYGSILALKSRFELQNALSEIKQGVDDVDLVALLDGDVSIQELQSVLQAIAIILAATGIDEPIVSDIKTGSLYARIKGKITSLIQRKEVQEAARKIGRDAYDAATKASAEKRQTEAATTREQVETKLREIELEFESSDDARTGKKLETKANALRAIEEARQSTLISEKLRLENALLRQSLIDQATGQLRNILERKQAISLGLTANGEFSIESADGYIFWVEDGVIRNFDRLPGAGDVKALPPGSQPEGGEPPS